MDDLIEALTIFKKYTSDEHPTGCEHDILFVYVDPALVSEEDQGRLFDLGFEGDGDSFYSYRFGSA